MSETYQGDQALVAAIVAGDRDAWLRLVQRHQIDIHYALIRALQYRGTNPSDDVLEDLEADLMLTLARDHFRRLQSYRGQCTLKQWLKVVAGHFAIDHLRKQRAFVPLPTQDGPRGLIDPAPSPYEQVEQQQLGEALVDLLGQLGDEDQIFVELYYRRELSFERIAAMMGTTVGATYARKNRLRKRLKKLAERAALI